VTVGDGSSKASPYGVVVNPAGTRAYVSNYRNNTISVIDLSNNSLMTNIVIPVEARNGANLAGSEGITINADGTRVYVANTLGNNVSVIDTITNRVVAIIKEGMTGMPQGITVRSTNTCPADTNGSIQMGIDQCKANPVSCGITSVDTNGSTQTGIDQCKTNPASCGITLADTNGSTQTGIDQCKANPVSCGIIVSTDQCKTNPASCNLFTQVQVDAAKQAGIDLCKTNPTSCNLFTQAQIDAAKQAAIAQCKTTPASCGITFIDNNGSTQVGIAQCKTNPASCGITKLDGISTNAFITPANKMIAGVLISGGTKRLMVRASSVDGAVDPLLEIVTYPDRKPLGSNDSWATDPGAAELTQKKLAPGRATDAAMIINLPPGLFTMEITSKNGGSGAGVIEVYDMAVFP